MIIQLIEKEGVYYVYKEDKGLLEIPCIPKESAAEYKSRAIKRFEEYVRVIRKYKLYPTERMYGKKIIKSEEI